MKIKITYPDKSGSYEFETSGGIEFLTIGGSSYLRQYKDGKIVRQAFLSSEKEIHIEVG